MTLKHLSIQNAYLMIRFLELEATQSLGLGNNTRKIQIYGIEHLVIGYAALHGIVLMFGLATMTAHGHIIQPLLVVRLKALYLEIGNVLVQLVLIHNGRLPSAGKALSIAHGLIVQSCQIKATTKV